jgi:hypothetical protein
VTKVIPKTIINFVTPKAGAKRELLFNKPATGYVKIAFEDNDQK